MFGTLLRTLALLGLLAPLAPARGPATQTRDDRSAGAARQVFYVRGGTCSRSWRLLATCNSIEDAHRAAQGFRDKKFRVEVTTHARDTWIIGERATECHVYVNPCKGWVLHQKTDSLKKAQEIAEARKKNGDNVEIVLLFDPK